METQFGLSHVWQQGDFIIRTVALVLLSMSVTSWVVIILKILKLRLHRQQAQSCERFWHSPNLPQALQQLGKAQDNPFYQLAQQGQDASRHVLHFEGEAPHHLADNLDLSDWITRSLRNAIDDATAQLQSGMTLLASIGSTAPFVGLFGTVWGIYHALLGIGTAGQASIDQIAGPIGEALIMTALGLLVAIPAVLGYNALVRGNKAVLHKLNRFAHDLHAYFVTGARVGAHGNTPAAAPPQA